MMEHLVPVYLLMRSLSAQALSSLLVYLRSSGRQLINRTHNYRKRFAPPPAVHCLDLKILLILCCPTQSKRLSIRNKSIIFRDTLNISSVRTLCQYKACKPHRFESLKDNYVSVFRVEFLFT